MKNLILFILLPFLMLAINGNVNAFITEKPVAAPSDSCSEVTLSNGQVLKIKIVSLERDKILYQDCGMSDKAPTHTVFMSSIKKLKVIGSPKGIRAYRTGFIKNNKVEYDTSLYKEVEIESETKIQDNSDILAILSFFFYFVGLKLIKRSLVGTGLLLLLISFIASIMAVADNKDKEKLGFILGIIMIVLNSLILFLLLLIFLLIAL